MQINVGILEEDLQKLIDQVTDVAEDDDEYWAELACGQDTQEAEASGFLHGQKAGLLAALALIRYENPTEHLMLEKHER